MILHLGDCLEVLPTIEGPIDMVFADLPYGVTANKWDSVIPFEPLWRELLRVGKKNCAYVFTATQPFATALICSQPKLFRYDLVWCKTAATGYANAKYRPMAAHEQILIFSYATANPMSALRMTYNPQKTQGKPYIRHCDTRSSNYGTQLDSRNPRLNASGDRHPRSYVTLPSGRMGHPTQKPVALLEWLIKTYSNPGDTILDPVMGSGTSGVACLNTGRNFIGIEKDPHYFRTAIKRIDVSSAA